jgi:hypothetical protein
MRTRRRCEIDAANRHRPSPGARVVGADVSGRDRTRSAKEEWMTVETLAAPDRGGVWAAWDSLSESWRAYLYTGAPSSVRYTHWRWLGALPTEPPGPKPAHLALAWRWVAGMRSMAGATYVDAIEKWAWRISATPQTPDFECPSTRALALVVLARARTDLSPSCGSGDGSAWVNCWQVCDGANYAEAFAMAFWAAP